MYQCVAQTVRFRVYSRCACKCGSRCAFPELRAFLGKPEKQKSTRAHVDQENSVQKRAREIEKVGENIQQSGFSQGLKNSSTSFFSYFFVFGLLCSSYIFCAFLGFLLFFNFNYFSSFKSTTPTAYLTTIEK